jgi:hypothetical protein
LFIDLAPIADDITTRYWRDRARSEGTAASLSRPWLPPSDTSACQLDNCEHPVRVAELAEALFLALVRADVIGDQP